MLFLSNWKLLLQSNWKCAKIYSYVNEGQIKFKQLDCMLNSHELGKYLQFQQRNCCSSLSLQLLVSTRLHGYGKSFHFCSNHTLFLHGSLELLLLKRKVLSCTLGSCAYSGVLLLLFQLCELLPNLCNVTVQIHCKVQCYADTARDWISL